ncbi:MAG: TolB-like translocation protein, partial [Solirubrobacteraceae bacterium]
TLATGDRTYLVQGSVSARSGRTLHENVECPSLSPDGSRVAYKKRVGSGTAIWRLHVLDLKTMRETRLAESRPIDDQVEWLDDARILYKVDEQIWSVRADGTGPSQRFQTASDSPAVVRG